MFENVLDKRWYTTNTADGHYADERSLAYSISERDFIASPKATLRFRVRKPTFFRRWMKATPKFVEAASLEAPVKQKPAKSVKTRLRKESNAL